jgi:hypothetical protein
MSMCDSTRQRQAIDRGVSILEETHGFEGSIVLRFNMTMSKRTIRQHLENRESLQ